MKPYSFLSIICLVVGASLNLYSQNITTDKKSVVVSAIKGTISKTDTIKIQSIKGESKISDITISGAQANLFKIVSSKPKRVAPGISESIAIEFSPDVNFIGIARAVLILKGTGVVIELTGLSTKGLEGENEATLSDIVNALGYSSNVGWTTLPNNLKPVLQGEELAPSLFTKADNTKPVEMIPVARYSPDFTVNFGCYVNSSHGPKQQQIGILATAGKYPEHQVLFPAIALGGSSIDPGNKEFGFYAISPSHTVYSEDMWNILFYPSHASHGMRIYPIKDKKGKIIADSYLVCMEEAANGDYNDYVFIVKNIKPVLSDSKFTAIMNGKNFEGWYSWLEKRGKNNDPEKIFTIEAGGIIHDTGKELGYLMTQESFENYHFILDFKWGNDRWPPRDKNKRDSGICYNIPEDAPDGIWPQSVECQIQEGDVGDFWLLGYSTIQVDGKQNPPFKHSQLVKKKDNEKPNGEWNTVEVISFNGKCAHIVNGVVVNYGENSSLIGGRILLQSEYAELYYRNIKIRKLN